MRLVGLVLLLAACTKSPDDQQYDNFLTEVRRFAAMARAGKPVDQMWVDISKADCAQAKREQAPSKYARALLAECAASLPLIEAHAAPPSE